MRFSLVVAVLLVLLLGLVQRPSPSRSRSSTSPARGFIARETTVNRASRPPAEPQPDSSDAYRLHPSLCSPDPDDATTPDGASQVLTIPLEFLLIDAHTGLEVPDALATLLLDGQSLPSSPGATSYLPLTGTQPERPLPTAIRASAAWALSGDINIPRTIDPRTRHLLAIIPIWPEARVHVSTSGETADTIAGETYLTVAYGDIAVPARVDALFSNEWMIRNLPHHKGHRLRIHASRPSPKGDRAGCATFVWGDSSFASVSIAMQSALPVPGLATPPPQLLYDPELTVDDLAAGALDVYALDAAGQPVPGALIAVSMEPRTLLHRANQCGLAHFEGLCHGSWHVELRQPGLLPSVISVRVVPSCTTAVAIREGLPRSVLVQVVDEARQPVRFASISVDLATGAEYTAIRDDVQMATLYTNEAGSLALPNLPDDRVIRVDARFGSHHGSTLVGVGERCARIVIREVVR